MKRGFVIILLTVFILSINLPSVLGAPGQPERITYFASDMLQHGLWIFDPMTNQSKLVSEGIGINYQFSPDGHYLAFLANNLDRGKGLANTISLWVRDMGSGAEYVVESDFDTDSNLDARFEWLSTGELAVIQNTDIGERKIKIFKADGELIWTNPQPFQFLSFNAERILLKHRDEHYLLFYHLMSQSYEPLPVKSSIIAASLSTKGNYLCYQTLKELLLVNVKTGEKVYIDVGELSGEEFSWSPDETFLVYQTKKTHNETSFYELTVFNVSTGIKEFQVHSDEKINHSWSADEKQMAFSLHENGWSLFVWFPEQYSTITVRSGLKTQPSPIFVGQSHEFVYLDYVDLAPVIYSFNADQKTLKLIHTGPIGGSWSKASWTQAFAYSGYTSKSQMYLAGKSEVSKIRFVRALENLSAQTGKKTTTDYYAVLKWAPTHRTMVIREDEQTLTLMDEKGNMKRLYAGTKVSEPFWYTDGSYVSFVIQGEKRELLLYNYFKEQALNYALNNEKAEIIQWMDNRVWFFDGRLFKYYPLGNEWQRLAEWKEYWWNKPRVESAHYLADSIWQLGANLWLCTKDGKFKVITRLNEYNADGWEAQLNGFAHYSPDDEQILFHRKLVRIRGGREEVKWEIWVMDKKGQNQRYLCEGSYPQWLGNHQFVFLHDGDLHLANPSTGQILRLTTQDLQEQAFMISFDGALVAVVAKGKDDKVGIYIYELK